MASVIRTTSLECSAVPAFASARIAEQTSTAISRGLGVSIASGGRYDDLLGGFGEPRPATGGSLGLERILLLLEELLTHVSRLLGGP